MKILSDPSQISLINEQQNNIINVNISGNSNLILQQPLLQQDNLQFKMMSKNELITTILTLKRDRTVLERKLRSLEIDNSNQFTQ